MKTVVQKWGHSLALRIPKTMAEHIKVKAGVSVDIREDGETLFIRPSKTKLTLKELLAKVKPENLHEEIETGQAVGKEVW
jgi:antitoxin MazE